MSADGSRLGGGDHGKVDVPREVRSHRVVPVDPHRAQRAGLRLGLAVHEVVEDQCPVCGAEQSGKPYLVTARDIDQLVVVDDGAGGQLSPQRGDPLDMIDQVQLGDPQLLTLTPVLLRFRQPGEVHFMLLSGRALLPATDARDSTHRQHHRTSRTRAARMRQRCEGRPRPAAASSRLSHRPGDRRPYERPDPAQQPGRPDGPPRCHPPPAEPRRDRWGADHPDAPSCDGRRACRSSGSCPGTAPGYAVTSL